MAIDKTGIVSDYRLGYSISKLELKYGGRRKTLRKILFEAKLIDSIEPKRKKYFVGKDNIEIKNKLLLRYCEEKDLSVLSNEFNIPVMSIYNCLRKERVFDSKYGKEIHNNKVRKYSLNEHFFDVIDTEEKAYFLGILYADGTNSLKTGEVSLRLQENDIEVLKTLNNLIQPLKPIKFIPRKSESHENLRRLIINSKVVSNRLNELGIMPNKTFKLKYPKWLSENLHCHFIRGYFDGDGCVTFNKNNKQLCIGFTGTENMMTGIQEILIKKISFSKVKLYTRHPERNHNIKSLLYSGNGNAKRFYDYLYNNATIFMERKKNKFNKNF